MLGKRIDQNPVKVYPSFEDAHRDACLLQRGDKEWKYLVDLRRDNTAAIKVYDENGSFIDYWRVP